MIEKPLAAVWEITMGCNMRCRHCGSSCEQALSDELTTEEALKLCDDLAELGLEWVTLSGGEPTTRPDWALLVRRLRENGVAPNMLTNGWLLDEEIVDKAADAGINILAISLDGLETTHDKIRRPGSFQRVLQALRIIRSKGLDVMIITTVNRMNINELQPLREVLINHGVRGWQIQMGLPMGNLGQNREMVLVPAQMDEIINFAYETMQEGLIEVFPGDGLGYYNLKEMEIKKRRCGGAYPRGTCTAGKKSLGIMHNGDITGCTSMRNRQFIEGNIRRTSLRRIWENPANFAWNRQLRKEQLAGFCGQCRFAADCLGGCANYRLTTGGSVYAENSYCSYNVAVGQKRQEYSQIKDGAALKRKGMQLAVNGYYQLAEMSLAQALTHQPEDCEVLSFHGYVHFRLGNFRQAQEANEKVLQIKPKDSYAMKGLGLSLYRQGNLEEGIGLLQKVAAGSDAVSVDAAHDLAVILKETQENIKEENKNE